MNTKRRICLLLNSLAGGGAERVAVNLANGFMHEGIHVDIVVTNVGDAYSHLLLERNITNLHSQKPLIGTVLTIYRLTRYLHKTNPDALISGIETMHYLALVSRWLYRPALPFIAVIHTTLSRDWANSHGDWKRWIKKHLSRTLLRQHYRTVVAVSKAVARDAEHYLGLPFGAVDSIYNPVISKSFIEQSAQHLSPVISDNPIILAVGALRPLKNFSLLLYAFAQVRKKTRCRLIILGEGEERLLLENLAHSLGIAPDVSLPGFVENPYSYMSRAAVFTLTSNYEGLPSVLIEALACGCPVISTDCPSGPREILENGTYGTLVPVGDADALAHAIDTLLHTSPTMEQRSMLIHRAEDFLIEKATKDYLEKLHLTTAGSQ